MKLKYLLILLLFVSCSNVAIVTKEKGKCVRLNGDYAFFEIEYECKMVHKCIKTAYTYNNGKYKLGRTYILTQVLK